MRANALIHLVAALHAPAALGHDDPDLQLQSYAGHGEWEVWCLQHRETGQIRCNLNTVLIYKPRPDFRALIPRISITPDGGHRIAFDTEWQSSLARARFEFADGSGFSLAGCFSPCELGGEAADRLISRFATQPRAVLRFHDHLVESQHAELDLRGFRDALRDLRRLHQIATQKNGRNTSTD